MTMCLVKQDHPLVKLAQDAVTEFMKSAKDLVGKEEEKVQTIGLPSTNIFNQWLKAALDHYVTIGAKEQTQIDLLRKFAQELTQMEGLVEVNLAQMVPHIMISKPFDKSNRKVEVGILGQAKVVFDQAIYHLFIQAPGYRVLVGSAPKGQLERQLQTFIDEMGMKADEE